LDQLIGLAISPFVAAVALSSSWERPREAVALGGTAAALMYAYPELAPINLLAPACVLICRIWGEKPFVLRWLAFAAVAGTTTLVILLPAGSRLMRFVHAQFVQAMAASRPGEGYFPTLFTLKCAPAAILGLHEPFGGCFAPPRELAGLAV